VNYLRTKSKGKRFEITFYQRKESDPPDFKGNLVTYSLAAPTQRAARKWVKSIITAVAIQRSRMLNTKRESQRQALEGKQEMKRKSRSNSRLGRRTTLQSESVAENVPVTPISDEKKVEDSAAAAPPPHEKRSNSADLGLHPGFAVIPVSKLSIDLRQDDVWKAMLSPIMPASLGNQSGSGRGSRKHSRRNIVFSHDREALLHLMESSPLRSVTPTRHKSGRLSGVARNRKQIIISPFKLAVWDLLMLYAKRHSSSKLDQINLRERTIAVIQALDQPDSVLEQVYKKSDGIFFDAYDDDSASDVEFTTSPFAGKPVELIKAISEEKMTAEDFDVVVPIDYAPADISNPDLNFENIFFWICEMKRSEISGGISRKEKYCVLVVKDQEVTGLKHGKAWNSRFPTFKGGDMIEWLVQNQVCQSNSDGVKFASAALSKNFIALVLSDDNSDRSQFEEASFYYFTSDLLEETRKTRSNKGSSETRKVQDLDEKAVSRELDAKDLVSDEELSISLQANLSASENEEEGKGVESLSSVVTSKMFIDFFCALPNDSSILRCILKEMNSESKLPTRIPLAILFF
jgi:hypothetical protein